MQVIDIIIFFIIIGLLIKVLFQIRATKAILDAILKRMGWFIVLVVLTLLVPCIAQDEFEGFTFEDPVDVVAVSPIEQPKPIIPPTLPDACQVIITITGDFQNYSDNYEKINWTAINMTIGDIINNSSPINKTKFSSGIFA